MAATPAGVNTANKKLPLMAEARRVLKDQNLAAHKALFDEEKLDEDAEKALETLLKKGRVER